MAHEGGGKPEVVRRTTGGVRKVDTEGTCEPHPDQALTHPSSLLPGASLESTTVSGHGGGVGGGAVGCGVSFCDVRGGAVAGAVLCDGCEVHEAPLHSTDAPVTALTAPKTVSAVECVPNVPPESRLGGGCDKSGTTLIAPVQERHALLHEAHGVAHRSGAAMVEWLRNRGVHIWRGCGVECRLFVRTCCGDCQRVNVHEKANQPYQWGVSEWCGGEYSLDYIVKYRKFGVKIAVLTDHLSDSIRTQVLPITAGAVQVRQFLEPILRPPRGWVKPKSLNWDNDVTHTSAPTVHSLKGWLRSAGVHVKPTTPHSHSLSVAERSNGIVRCALDKCAINSVDELAVAVRGVTESLNDTPRARMRLEGKWLCPNDVPQLPLAERKTLAFFFI